MLANYIAWIIFGALAGWIMSQLSEAETSSEAHISILIGISSACLSGLILQLFVSQKVNDFNVAILIVSVLASVILLSILRGFSHHIRD